MRGIVLRQGPGGTQCDGLRGLLAATTEQPILDHTLDRIFA
ncbi:hypothetical protein [Frankia sp. AgPm24]|nr:hypothetical protein [Frankia sp. AgPm24]